MGLILVTPNSDEPITLADAKEHLRVQDDSEDAFIQSLIGGARGYAESETGRALLSQQWRYTADRFPSCLEAIRLRRVPLISVESIQYVNQSGNLTTLDPSQYIVDTTSATGEIAPAYGVGWPIARLQRNAVTVNFTCGYTSVELVPDEIINAMKLVLGDLYANREASVDGVRANDNPRAREMLANWRVPSI